MHNFEDVGVMSIFHELPKTDLEEYRSVNSDNYTNRSDFISGVHAETRGKVGNAFALEVVPADGDTAAYVACSAETVGTYVRYIFSSPIAGCKPGDVLQISWTCRVLSDHDARIAPKVMMCDGSKRGKYAVGSGLRALDAGTDFQECHLLMQVVAPVHQNLVHLVFEMESGSAVHMSDFAVTRFGSRPVKKSGGSAMAALTDIMTLPTEAGRALVAKGADGFLMTVNAHNVTGLAWDSTSPFTSAQIEFLINGGLVGVASADPIELDGSLSDRLPGEFRFTLPPESFEHSDSELTIRSGGATLRGTPYAFAFGAVQEGLLQVDWKKGELKGWAIDRRLGAKPATVEILVDGTLQTSVVANQRHAVLAGPQYNEGLCAFRSPIPPILTDGADHVLTVRVANGSPLTDGELPVRFNGSFYVSHVELVREGQIAGWAFDARRTQGPLEIEISVDGKPFGKVRADGPIPHLHNQRGAFTFPVALDARRIELRIGADTLLGEYDIVRRDGVAVLQGDVASSHRPVLSQSWRAILTRTKAEDLFDAPWYLASYPEVRAELESGVSASAFEHWANVGARSGRSPNGWFDESWYLETYADARQAVVQQPEISGFMHWLGVLAAKDWRAPSPAFDPKGFRGEGVTPRSALDSWLGLSGGLADPAVLIDPPKATAVRYRSLAEFRKRPGLLFDTSVRRLVEDLSLADRASGEKTAVTLEQNETTIVQRMIERPIKGQPLVSIIMPTYNRGFLIAEAVQSVLDQSWTNWELIICDDGSTDKTPMVVKAWDDPRIRYLQLEKTNGAVARNFGMAFSKGDYISFLDSDNLWHPLFLEMSIAELQNASGLISYSGYIDVEISGPRFASAGCKFTGFDYQELLRRNYIDLNTIMLNRVVYDSLGGFDESLGRVQDWDLMLKFGRTITPLAVPVFTTFYRRNVAWGQVTLLQSSTNFNSIVASNAMKRLYSASSALTVLPGDPAVTMVAGSDLGKARELIHLADLAAGASSVRLVLADTPEMRDLVADSAPTTDVAVTWRATGARDCDLLSGSIVIAADDVDMAPLQRLAGQIPLFQASASDEQLSLFRIGGVGGEKIPIGVMQLARHAVHTEEEDEAPATPGKLIVIAIPKAREDDWAVELLKFTRNGPSVLTVSFSEDSGYELRSFTGGREKPASHAPAQLMDLVGQSALVALLVESRLNRFVCTNLGAAAHAAGAALMVVSDPAYGAWAANRTAHMIAATDAGSTLKRIQNLLADSKERARIGRRQRRRFQCLYSRTAMKDRLALVLSGVEQ